MMITTYLFVAFSFLVLLTLKVEDNPKLNVIFSVFWIISIPLICLILLLHEFGWSIDVAPTEDGESKFGFHRSLGVYVLRVGRGEICAYKNK